MDIIYTRKAKRDLQTIREFYGARSPSALQNIVGDIVAVVQDLPQSISKGRQTTHPDVWEKLTPKYKFLLPYYVHGGKLYILRVYDTRREPLDYRGIVDLEE